MGCDIVAALGQATVGGQTLFGLNWHGHAPVTSISILKRVALQTHAAGATVGTRTVEVPQVRQTFAVLGFGPRGEWGLTHGLNEHNVAMGMASWNSRMPRPGLNGTDLVRLTLERSHSTFQAQEILTSLIARYGQGQADSAEGTDHIFLIADPQEALVIEAAGPYWAAIGCQQVRTVSDVGMIRQDRQRLAPGLIDHAVEQGWWSDDGSKIDFSASCGTSSDARPPALKRWGRATVLLEQQNGHIDPWFLRHMLAEHFQSVERAAVAKPVPTLANTFLTALAPGADAVAMAWCAQGPAQARLYFPVFLDGELPWFLQEGNSDRLPRVPTGLHGSEEIETWQARIDQQAEDFRLQARLLKKQGNVAQLRRQATLFMAQALESPSAAPEHRQLHRPTPAEDLAYIVD